jgi:two-component system LytT family response regulator
MIVDDEQEACDNLEYMLREYADVKLNVLGKYNTTKQAEQHIKQLQPDAVFMDIEMPNENAFHFLERITPINFEVVFVTAYDEYAIRAFRLNAVDYILKPISIPELRTAALKLQEKVQYKHLLAGSAQSYRDISNLVNSKAKHNRLTLRDSNAIEIVDFADVYFIEAQGSYSKVVFCKNKTTKEMVMSVSIADYEELLPVDLFYRIHKSYLINCAQIKKIFRDDNNTVLLSGNHTLPVSRRRFSQLVDFLHSHQFAHE